MLTKKLNLKKCEYAHILSDGSITLYYQERHKTSGKQVCWDMTVPKEEVPFKLHVSKFMGYDTEFKYKTIYVSNRIVPLLNDLVRVEIWPQNTAKGSPVHVMSVIMELKNKASLSFDEISISGHNHGGGCVKVMK